jgi:MurNAc alpha-1-phosphate uridylyltransferase
MTKPLASDVAMVMAAGIGKRMRPLTATRPKPLVRVAGKPLIDYARQAGRSRRRARGGQRPLPARSDRGLSRTRPHPAITISDERDALLETGGGMIRALPLIDADPFFCVNSDNIWLDGPRNAFGALSDAWDPEKMDALLLLVNHARAFNYQGPGDFHLDQEGRITRRRPAGSRRSSTPGCRPPAARCARGIVFHRRAVEPRHCRRAASWRVAYRAVVRGWRAADDRADRGRADPDVTRR